jgi:hypothetical protein
MGRPLKYNTEEDFNQALESYLDWCVEKHSMPNIAGFCAAQHMSRETYYEYGKKYSDTKKAFESFLESAWVQKLGGPSATGAIFYLKNAFREHYKDRNETDITSGGEKIPSGVDVEALALKMAAELKKKKT